MPEIERCCDLVMKGGITSGVVYPKVVEEVARRFHLVGIAGTSAGAIAASLAAAAEYRRRTTGSFAGFEQVVLPGWTEVVPLVQRLGGYGPAQLTVGIYAAPAPPPDALDGEDKDANEPPPPPPPKHSLYARLSQHTRLRRWTTVAEPMTEMLGSLERELQRASGQESWEPEDEPPAS